mgnify:CR=1 FL=1
MDKKNISELSNNERLEEALGTLENKLKELDQDEAQRQKKEIADELSSAKKLLHGVCSDISSKESKYVQLRNEIIAEEKRLLAVKEEIESTNNTLTSVHNELSKAMQLKKEKEEETLGLAQHINDAFQSERESLAVEQKKLSDAKFNFEVESMYLENEIQKTKDALAGLRDELTNARVSKETLFIEVKILEQKKKEIDTALATNEIACHEKSQIKNKFTHLIEELQNQKSRLNNDCEELKNAKNALQKEIEMLKTDREKHRQKLLSLIETGETLGGSENGDAKNLLALQCKDDEEVRVQYRSSKPGVPFYYISKKQL